MQIFNLLKNKLTILTTRGMLFWHCVVCFLISLHLTERVILSLVGQESNKIINELSFYIFVIFCLQMLLCRWIGSFSRTDGKARHLFCFRWNDGRMIFPAILTFNIVALVFSFIPFNGYLGIFQILILVILFGVLMEFFVRGNRNLFIFLALLFLSANIEIGVQIYQKFYAVPPSEKLNWRDSFVNKFQKVSFTKKPNVYLISWDSLIPDSIAEKLIQIPQETLAYNKYLSENNFRIFKNVFVDRVAVPHPERKLQPSLLDPSRASLNSLLLLDPIMWDNQPGLQDYIHHGYNHPYHYFEGARKSPLYEIFKENNYKIFVSNRDYHFGIKGQYISKYFIYSASTGQCNFGTKWFYFQMFHFCELRRFFLPSQQAYKHRTLEDVLPWYTLYVRDIQTIFRQNIETKQPWLNFIYLGFPGHVSHTYRGNSERIKETYRQAFVAQSKTAAHYMQEVMQTIRNSDPTAIVLFFGDHGTGIIKGVRSEETSITEEEKYPYMIDVHGVSAAIYPPDACASHMVFPTKYITTAMLARALIVCLADGEDPVNWKIDYNSPYANIKFDDYLYE